MLLITQTTYNKHYLCELEENFRFNIFLANTERVKTHNDLNEHGLVPSIISLDQYAASTLDEIPSVSIPLIDVEWIAYKVYTAINC